MSAVAQEIEGVIRRLDYVVGCEGPEELEMARSDLMHARQDRIGNPERRVPVDPVGRNTLSGAECAARGRMLQGANHGGSDGDDAPAFLFRPFDCRNRRRRNDIGLVEGKPGVERGIAGGRDAGSMGEGGEPTPRARSAARRRQSSTNPAEGGSKAAGRLAILVQLSQGASGPDRWAYWIGCPCRASPAQMASAEASKVRRMSRG